MGYSQLLNAPRYCNLLDLINITTRSIPKGSYLTMDTNKLMQIDLYNSYCFCETISVELSAVAHSRGFITDGGIVVNFTA